MLRELSVHNFAVIDELQMEFDRGFTALTGETGAGKSIIVEALGAVLGERVGSDVIRSGAEQARVEGVFDLADAPSVPRILEEAGIEADDVLIITRAISPDRSRYWINRRPATLSLVQRVTRNLVDIHGQHEHQALIHEPVHLQFLDEFGGPAVKRVLQAYQDAWEQLRSALDRLERLRHTERDRAQREDLLRFQVREIRDAGLEPGEEDRLRQERTKLQNLERILEGMAVARQALGGEEEAGAVDLLARAAEQLSALAEFDATLGEIAQQVEQAHILATEALRSLDDQSDLAEFEPGRLEQVEARLAEIHRLKRKYGDTVEDILAYLERAEQELATLEDSEQLICELESQVDRLRERAGELAEELSDLRREHAARLEKTVQRELGKMGIKNGQFAVEFSREESDSGLPGSDGCTYAASARGIDAVRFLFTGAPGEQLRPLSQVASGGELSRLMLIFKSICARGADIPTLVFDEVDVGIGGLTAHAVGRKLAELGRRAQVFCITHLAQIASRADWHFLVDKHTRRGRTAIVARLLGDEERVEELARMLGARRDQKAAVEHARQMLAQARQERGHAKVGSR